MKVNFSVEDILEMNPCEEYTAERIAELFAGRETVTGLDISKMDIPGADFRWVVLRPDFITENNLHKIAIYCAGKIALPIWLKYYPDDNRPAEAIRIKKLWLKGKATDAELNAAYAAVCAAARVAANVAVCATANVAVCATANVAAYAAAYAVCATANVAAYAAARVAARAAAFKGSDAKIKKYIIKILKEQNKIKG